VRQAFPRGIVDCAVAPGERARAGEGIASVAVTLIYETHSTTFDNEAGLASGLSEVDLSPTGEQQARNLGARHADEALDAVFASDLGRARRTAEIAFVARAGLHIECDQRLREIDYGSLTCAPKRVVDAVRARHVDTPFPGGESYRQVAERMQEFIDDMARRYPGGRVVVIGHHATHVAFEHLCSGASIADVLAAPYTWQPGWEYRYAPEGAPRGSRR
jgi:alpha-ribazole phosphatase/probable phosphoglycerate mutase